MYAPHAVAKSRAVLSGKLIFPKMQMILIIARLSLISSMGSNSLYWIVLGNCVVLYIINFVFIVGMSQRILNGIGWLMRCYQLQRVMGADTLSESIN